MYYALDCPFCLKEAVGFTGVSSHNPPHPKKRGVALAFVRCNLCGMCVVAEVGVGQQDPNAQAKFPGIGEVWPKPPTLEAPTHTPDRARTYYLQGLSTLRRGEFDAAGMTFRKCLDSALRALGSTGKESLKKRIDALPPDVGVTDAMKKWAHAIREDGNDAAHEDEPFEEGEARMLQSFTELFLTYTFSLPGMLEQRKAATNPTPDTP